MKKISDSEFEIMKSLRSRDGPMTSNEILDGVRDKYDGKLAGLNLIRWKEKEGKNNGGVYDRGFQHVGSNGAEHCRCGYSA